jgi:prophage regulatory protein
MKMISYPELKTLKGIPYSRVHVDRLEKAGQFPKRVHLSANCVAWRDDELDEFLEARAAARNTEEAA